MAADRRTQGPSSDRIAMNVNIPFHRVQLFCEDFRRGGQNKAGTILDLLFQIKEENILSSRPNINRQYLHSVLSPASLEPTEDSEFLCDLCER
jgi:hypothetical protein